MGVGTSRKTTAVFGYVSVESARGSRAKSADFLSRGEPRARHQAPMVSKDELVEHLHHRLAQSFETQLRHAHLIDAAMSGHHARNLERLRQSGIDIDREQ